MNNIQKKNFDIDKYIVQVDLIDIYITKHIKTLVKNKKHIKILNKYNFLLTITNNNGKNALIILLETGYYDIVMEFIKNDYNILNYKNTDEDNLLKIILLYDYFYEFINDFIMNLDYMFVIKIITECNIHNENFIDKLLFMLNLDYNFPNKEVLINKLTTIVNGIYLLDNEKQTYIITKLCKHIGDEKFLLKILVFINFNNFDIYHDPINMLTCLDYLFYKEFYETIKFIIDKTNYIEFANLNNNIVFNFINESTNNINIIRYDIVLMLLRNSNILTIKNSNNENIFYGFIKNFKLPPSVIIDYLDTINLYEQNIN